MVENEELLRQEISQKLKESGYKLTPQRGVTVTTLIENRGKFLTAEEIFMMVKNKNPSIGLATVYRTLDLLDELEILNKKRFHDGLTRFDLYLSLNKIQPYYLICSNCKKINEIREDLFSHLSDQIKENYRFKVTIQDVTFHGLCEDCQRKERVYSE